MKRFSIELSSIADWHNIATAAHLAARNKRQQQDVINFFSHYESSISELQQSLLAARLPFGVYHSFKIFDPKPRIIQAAPFADRVAHHALMRPLIKPLDNWQVPTSYACRVGKGVHAAVAYAQRQCRRFPVYLKMDVLGYFNHISHSQLLALLRRRFRGEGLFQLLKFVLKTYQNAPEKGLPIGALTSQHFANLYLTPADRWLIDQPQVASHCRYMDDTVIWCENKQMAKDIYLKYSQWLKTHYMLDLKPAIIQQSQFGLTFCGYRIRPHKIRPGKRRLKQFQVRMGYWQQAYTNGIISMTTLQQNTDALLAMLQPADCWHWRAKYFNHQIEVEQ